jgi:hypothetical protein
VPFKGAILHQLEICLIFLSGRCNNVSTRKYRGGKKTKNKKPYKPRKTRKQEKQVLPTKK